MPTLIEKSPPPPQAAAQEPPIPLPSSPVKGEGRVERVRWDERGIALVSALMISLLLTLVVIALAYRVGLFSVGTRQRVVKSQSLYTADLGLSQGRYFLMAKECAPPHWNACIPGINDSTFTNISSGIRSVFPVPMPEFRVADQKVNLNLAGSLIRNGNELFTYRILAKTTNIPKVVNLVVVSERPGAPSQTVIDAGLLFTKPLGSDYKQLGQGGTREGLSGESLGADSSTVRSTF